MKWFWEDEPNLQIPQTNLDIELDSRASPSVDTHHHVNGPDTGRNSGEADNKKMKCLTCE